MKVLCGRVHRSASWGREGLSRFNSLAIGGHLVVVEGIPARVCDRCADATFERETTETIRRMVHGEKCPTRRVNVDVFAFAPVTPS